MVTLCYVVCGVFFFFLLDDVMSGYGIVSDGFRCMRSSSSACPSPHVSGIILVASRGLLSLSLFNASSERRFPAAGGTTQFPSSVVSSAAVGRHDVDSSCYTGRPCGK